MKEKGKYIVGAEESVVANEPLVAYRQPDYFDMANNMIAKDYIKQISKSTKLTLAELMDILPISMETYKRKKAFDSNVTEKILEIEEVYKEGMEAFGERFHQWMETENIALGNIKPKILLSNSFGVRRLLDQIGRIKHGILA